MDPNKDLLTQPALSLSIAPVTQSAVTVPPVADTTTPSQPNSPTLYLPVINR